jgi:Cu/Ag efflux protein CusF
MIRLPKWMLIVLALALVIGLSAPVVAAETAKGKIKSVTADKREFVLTDTNGKDWTFHMDDKATVRLNDKASKLDDLKVGDEVEIKYEKKGDRFMAEEIKCTRK